jgi:hypothetical protein
MENFIKQEIKRERELKHIRLLYIPPSPISLYNSINTFMRLKFSFTHFLVFLLCD